MFRLFLDGFQPYERVQYSVDALFLTIENLPPALRGKPENMILLALIPGAGNADDSNTDNKGARAHTVNADMFHRLLTPFVDELLEFWTGVWLNLGPRYPAVVVQAILGLCVCDVPATTTLLGLRGHGSNRHFCGKCDCEQNVKNKNTVGDGSEVMNNFREFKKVWVDDPTAKTNTDAMRTGRQWLAAPSKDARDKVAEEHGFRYSPLCARLPYFDAIHDYGIDLMHNVLEGLFKNLFEVCTAEGYFTPSKFQTMQRRVDEIKLPPEIGGIPRNIGSRLAHMKADQVCS